MDIRIEHISHWLGNYPGDLNWANQNFFWKQVREKEFANFKAMWNYLKFKFQLSLTLWIFE